ncbi:MAG: hypothetical protein ABIE92_07650, partial [bacterium]
MKRLCFTALLLICAFGFSVSADSDINLQGKSFPRNTADTGGPDDFGYIWMDSNETGGPVFEWLDITAVGQLVSGLGDDDFTGPFDLGFSLQYYWYSVESLFIGSNGYITFDAGALLSQPFPDSIPDAAAPHNYIAPYAADWYPSLNGQGETWFWTNSIDSAVVSFINYPAFYIGGAHDFQVILSNSDNSIKFQYGEQQGLVLNHDILIGIESISGAVGLEHSHDGYIAFADFAIEFYYPTGSSFEYHDLAAWSIVNPTSEAFFMLPNEILLPSGIISNLGTETISDLTTAFSISDEIGQPIYSSPHSPASIDPDESMELYYGPSWQANTAGKYTLELNVQADLDQNPANDAIRASCYVVELPGSLQYDDGIANSNWSWTSGSGGLAQRSVPPAYHCRIDSIYFYIAAGNTRSEFIAQILDDDGANGAPGTILYADTVETEEMGYYGLDITAEDISFASGAFYVAWFMVDASSSGLGMDTPQDGPASRQTWEFTGSWMPFRHKDTHDALIGCYVSHEPPENSPPEIVARFPVQLDTLLSGSDHLFWGSAQDPDNDSLTWEITLDGVLISEDSSTVINFDSTGSYEIVCRVSDNEFQDSIVWHIDFFIDALNPDVSAKPGAWALHPLYPNPFNNSATLRFSLPKRDQIALDLFDIQG